jgi:hypothetical protein
MSWFEEQKHHRTMKEATGVVSEDTTAVAYVPAVEAIVSSAAAPIVNQNSNSVTIDGVTTYETTPSWGMTI